MDLIKCIAVDDEPVSLGLIESYIKKIPYLDLLCSCTSAVTALKTVHAQPELQLIFLDIQMADLTGIELAKIVEQSEKRKTLRIIFTTAYDHYALEGYRVDALDYLLKPFSFVDFSKAASKALDYFTLIQSTKTAPDRQNFVAEADAATFIYLKVEYQLVKINTNDILYIEGLKDYVKVHLINQPKPVLSLISLKILEERLPSNRFLRIHRSYIIALAHVQAITKNSVQIQQTTIYVTEQYKEAFNRFLEKWL